MLTVLHDFTQRPTPFSRYTATDLWTRPHLAEQMLAYHLDQSTSLASRPVDDIEPIVTWIDGMIPLEGRSVCDLGCGPGLYATRFAERGASVTGIDISRHSLAHAAEESARSGSTVRWVHADYLTDPLPDGFDLVTLIYYDFGALSPRQRTSLLARIHRMLAPGGKFVLDVLGMGSFSERQEQTVVEQRLMDGFWAPGDYVGLQRTLLYPDEAVSLDRYLIVEPEENWQIFNWLQYYTPARLSEELMRAGFTVDTIAGSLAGEPLREDSPTLGVVAGK